MGSLATTLLARADQALIGEYWQILRPYPLGRVLGAIEAAKRECEYFPRPARLLELMRVGVEPPPPRMLPQPELSEPEVERVRAIIDEAKQRWKT